MLKINLLPVRQLKKRAKAKQELSLLATIFCLVLFACVLFNIHQTSRIDELNSSIAQLNKEEKSYATVLKKIEKLKKEKKELIRKGEVIDTLQADSAITVHILDQVANSVDNSRIWLNSMSQNGNSVQISGIALDNRTISDFMNSLKTQSYVRAVSLSETSQETYLNRDLQKFSISCVVGVPQPAKQESQDS